MAVSDLDSRLQDIARIAFVTRRFHELQGLIPAMLGAGLIFGPLLQHSLWPRYNYGPFQALTFASVTAGVTVEYLRQLYRNTFGEAVATWSQKMRAVIPMQLVLWGGLADMTIEFDRPTPSVAAMALVGYALWVVARDWPFRVHHLVGGAAGIMAAAITTAAPPLLDQFGPPDPARSEAFLLSYTILGLGLVATGLGDHQLLATTSARPKLSTAARPGRALARTEYGGLRAAIALMPCLATAATLWWVGPAALQSALPLALLLSALTVMAVISVVQLRSDAHGETCAPSLHADTDSLIVMFLLAVAAAVDSVIGTGGPPTALPVTIAVAGAWVAVRDWPYRRHYLIATAAMAVFAVMSRGETPARGVTMLIFAASAAFTLQGACDYVIARGRRDGGGFTDQEHGTFHVDTI
jgi:hypothetical protein